MVLNVLLLHITSLTGGFVLGELTEVTNQMADADWKKYFHVALSRVTYCKQCSMSSSRRRGGYVPNLSVNSPGGNTLTVIWLSATQPGNNTFREGLFYDSDIFWLLVTTSNENSLITILKPVRYL